MARFAVALASFLAAAAHAQGTCRTSPNLVGACFTVHGTLRVSEGTTPPTTIVPIGTGKVLGVWDRQNKSQSGELLPPSVAALIEANPRGAIDGDYEVCPFAKEVSGVRPVCIQSASNLTLL
jgi:hypothetical protein